MNKIILKNISKKYFNGKVTKVLNDINFEFELGNTYSIVGPSGSGKSTLLNMLSLIDSPTSGSIEIFDNKINNELKDQNDIIRSKNIGIIYQDKNLLPDFTCLENVYFPKLLATKNRDLAVADAKKIIKKIGLYSKINNFPSELSGGEAQRIAISRALINSPKIILADEPTGSLDFDNAKNIFNLLFSLKSKDRIIIFATHNRYFANLADCKIKMIDGKMLISNARIT